MSEKEKHLVVVAAGTGGHVMPGLAVARVMKERGWRVSWIGTTTGMEARLVARDGITFHGLNFQGVRGRGLLGALKGAFKLVVTWFNARKLLKADSADMVFSTGGYIAVPVGWAAKSTGTPLVLMNCDADLLMSTHTLLSACDALACGFAGGARSFAKEKGHTTGNPVREDIAALPPPRERMSERSGVLRILIFGGSLGAKVLNDTLPEILARIPHNVRPLVVHQTGRDRDEEVREHYRQLGVEAEVVAFIDDMAARYAASDLVICRAGATSVSELCAAGVPSILVPFVAKTTAHQRGNAQYMSNAQAAIAVEQREFTIEKMVPLIMELSRDKLIEMGENARRIGKPQAALTVADLIEVVLKNKKK